MNKILLTTILSVLLLTSVCGCSKEQQYSPEYIDFQIKEDVNRSIDIIEKSTIKIEEKSNNILEVINSIPMIPIEIKEDIKFIINNARIIKEENTKIKSTIVSLKKVVEKIEKIEDISKQIEKDRNELKEKLRIAEESAEAENRKMLQRIIFLSILGFGGSVALMLLGNAKIGTVGIGCSLSTLVLSIVINQHIILISWIGMGLILLIGIYLIYQAFIQGKIKKELIQTTELVKDNLTEEKKEEIFGKKSEVKRVQSLNTENEVKRIKSKIKKGSI